MGKQPILALLSAITVILVLACGTPPEPTPTLERETRPAETPRPTAGAIAPQVAAPASQPVTREEPRPAATSPALPTPSPAGGPAPAPSMAEPATPAPLAAASPDSTPGPTPPPPAAFTSVSVGSPYACSVRTDGAVDCWLHASPYSLVQAPKGKFTSVTVGHSHGCAIRTDGSAVCWGLERDEQTQAPGGWAFTILALGLA